MHKVGINKEPVELYKILKFEGLTTSAVSYTHLTLPTIYSV